MIDLITGLPGNAKTAYAISFVRAWAEKEDRPVYYSGIPELTLPWTSIEPEKWMECPPRSIVIVDECQRVFRNRSINAAAPKYVTDLETHRHLGIDLVFITQHPMLIDPAIRRLTGRHRHLVRIWGMEASTIHKWDVVKDGCDKPAQRKDSEKVKWKFDKSVYGLYKSAEVHTVKRQIPMRVKLLVLVPVAIALAAYTVYALLIKPKQPAPGVIAPGAAGATQGSPGAGQRPEFDPVAAAKEYVYNQTPRVADIPHTAPKFDELTKPTAVPVPAACVSSSSRCQCYNQQGTKMQVEYSMCRDIAQNGFFEEFSHAQATNAPPAAYSPQVVAVQRSQEDPPVQATVLPKDGYGIMGRSAPGVRVPGGADPAPASLVYPTVKDAYNQRQANARS